MHVDFTKDFDNYLSRVENISDLLKQMVEVDQKVLNENSDDLVKIKKVMDSNRKVMKAIVRKHGLISISKFGKEASFNAWLLIQHFPKTSIRFMEKYLELMERSVNDVKPSNMALLKDRINVYKGKPQIYGSQLRAKKGTKICEFRPIKDIKKVDQLRKSVGLESLSEYAKIFKETNGKGYEVIMPEGYVN